jgi:transcription antitermination factor NusG
MKPLRIEESVCETSRVQDSMAVFPWFAVQVRGRHEARVADHLQGKGYEWFLPLYKCRKRWSDRVKVVDCPLFPGYLFCRLDPQNRLPILMTPGVIRLVGQNGWPTPVDEAEISAIQAAVRSGLPNEPWPFLSVGDRIRIESGPLCELEGIVVKHKGRNRLVLSVTLLQRSVAVEIDSANVTPLVFSAVARDESYCGQQASPLFAL